MSEKKIVFREHIPLLKWPDERLFKPWTLDTECDFERQLSQATMARLRVSLEALTELVAKAQDALHGDTETPLHDAVLKAQEALAMIGKLPVSP